MTTGGPRPPPGSGSGSGRCRRWPRARRAGGSWRDAYRRVDGRPGQAAARRSSRRSWAARYGRARRWPPRSVMARSSARSARTTASTSGRQPRRSHSASQSTGLRCPRSRLHRPHASTSFSSHDGPPLILGTRWSVVARTGPVQSRRHQTQRAPSRAIALISRSRRPARFHRHHTRQCRRPPARRQRIVAGAAPIPVRRRRRQRSEVPSGPRS